MNNIIKTKKCNGCGETKKIEEFPKDRTKRGGVGSQCKECGRKAWKERDRREKRGEKRCSVCGVVFKFKNKKDDTCGKDECVLYAKKRKGIYSCRLCSKKFKWKCNSNNIFCSRDCAFEWMGENGRKDFLDYKKTNCKYCGSIIEYLKDKKDYCSSECERRDNPEECCYCGKEFAKFNNNTYCSDECRENHRKKREREKHPNKIINGVCEECGKEFTNKYGEKRRMFCSDKCGKNAFRKTDKHKALRTAARHKRRMRKNNGKVEKFTKEEILERDGWRCGLCGKRIGKKYPANHGRSGSIDHIIPLARGGDHTKENVQAAHRICNSRKSAKEDGNQLRLFG